MTDIPVGNSCTVNALGNSPAHTQREPQSIRSEAHLEAAIEAAKQRMHEAPTRREKIDAWREMCWLMDQRT